MGNERPGPNQYWHAATQCATGLQSHPGAWKVTIVLKQMYSNATNDKAVNKEVGCSNYICCVDAEPASWRWPTKKTWVLYFCIVRPMDRHGPFSKASLCDRIGADTVINRICVLMFVLKFCYQNGDWWRNGAPQQFENRREKWMLMARLWRLSGEKCIWQSKTCANKTSGFFECNMSCAA